MWNDLDLFTIHHLMMDCSYTRTAILYAFLRKEELSRALDNMVSASKYAWNSHKLVSESGEEGAEGRQSHIHEDAVCFDPTVSVTSILNNLHPDKSGALSKSVALSWRRFKRWQWEVHGSQHCTKNIKTWKWAATKISTAFLNDSASYDSAGKLMLVCNISCKNYRSIEIMENIDQITAALYPLREALNKRKPKLLVSVIHS